MKIAYLTTYNSNDINQWSGLGYYMCKSLTLQGVDIIKIDCSVPFSKWLLLKVKLIKLICGKKYQLDRDHSYLKKVSSLAEQKLKNLDFDLVLSPGSLPISFLKTDKPIIFWTDATYASLVNFYPSWNNISRQSFKNGNTAEQLAINKASLILYTSYWALKDSLNKYGADPAKVKQVPVGSNFESHMSVERTKTLIKRRMTKTVVNFLFVGVDWNRKGGDMAVEVVVALRKLGINATLTVVGVDLPKPLRELEFIESYPFISKSTKQGVEKLSFIFERANYFILPTKADCFAVVFAEASSFGLPVITSNVGGSASAIKNGYNGYCLNLSNFVETAVEKIVALHKCPENYRAMSMNAFTVFQKGLNWNVIGKKAYDAIKSVVQDKAEDVAITNHKESITDFEKYDNISK